MNAPDYGSVTRLAKAAPASGNPHLRLEWVTDKNGHRVRRYHRTHDEKIGERVDTASGVSDMASAEAYWQKHFVSGSPHRILCRYGTKTYSLNVSFVRNHAFTSDESGMGADAYRSFAIDRARTMHWIWHVISSPRFVNPSQTDRRNKQLDAKISDEVELDGGMYGRVILKPTPTPSEISQGKPTHNFEFVSWHLPNQKQWDAAQSAAKAKHTTPVEMKKAHCLESAFPLFLDHKPKEVQARPASFVPRSSFDDSGCRKSFDSNRLTGSDASIAQPLHKSNPDYGSVYRRSHEPTPAQLKAGNYRRVSPLRRHPDGGLRGLASVAARQPYRSSSGASSVASIQ